MRLSQVRLGLVVIMAVLLMANETTTLYRDPVHVTRSALVVAAVVAPGVLVRCLLPRIGWVRWPLWLLQTVLGFVALRWLYAGTSVPALVEQATTSFREGTAPLPPSPGVGFVLLLLPWLVSSVIELFIHVGRLPGLAILPLAGWYALLAFLPHPQARWLSLVALGVGYAAILAVDTANRGRTWRANLSGDSGSGSDTDLTVMRITATVLVPALAAALLLGSVMPLFNRVEVSSRDGSVAMGDPRLDLRQNLHASRKQEVLQYWSSIPGGVRLRLAVMSDLSTAGWNVSAFPSKRLSATGDDFGPVPGLTMGAGMPRQTTVDIGAFPSQYLPLPYAPQHLQAPHVWGWDEGTSMVYTLDDGGRDVTNHLSYSVDSLDVVPSPGQLSAVRSADSGDAAQGVPPAFPQSVADLTARVIAGAQTPLEKASMLQEFLRSDAFTYDLDRAPTLGGFSGIEQFLLVERVGYCEQYAGAYAAMARAAGLPSRVVIGFLPGEDLGSGRHSVANLDMHSWPEVWFDGYGWLPFEPTPDTVSGAVPPYSADVEPSPETPSPTPTSSPTAEQPTAAPSQSVEQVPEVVPERRRGDIPWAALGMLGGLALLGLAAAAPGWWRRRLRIARFDLRDDGADKTLALWHEVRDTVLDLGGSWPDGESPRATAAGLEPALTPPTGASLRRLAVGVERVRYATTPGTVPEGLVAGVQAVVAELTQRADQRARLQARWLPRSLVAGISRSLRRGGVATPRGDR